MIPVLVFVGRASLCLIIFNGNSCCLTAASCQVVKHTLMVNKKKGFLSRFFNICLATDAISTTASSLHRCFGPKIRSGRWRQSLTLPVIEGHYMRWKSRSSGVGNEARLDSRPGMCPCSMVQEFYWGFIELT